MEPFLGTFIFMVSGIFDHFCYKKLVQNNIFFDRIFWWILDPFSPPKTSLLAPLGVLLAPKMRSWGTFGASGAILVKTFWASKFKTIFNMILRGSGGAKREVLGRQNGSKIHPKMRSQKIYIFHACLIPNMIKKVINFRPEKWWKNYSKIDRK